MTDKEVRISLGLKLDDYRYEARHYPGQGHDRLIDFHYVQGTDFSYRCPPWLNMGFDAYGAVGKCSIVYGLLTGRLDYGSPTVRDIAYRCQLCGGCDVAGKRNLDSEFQLMLESLRVRLVEKGYGPMPQHVALTSVIDNSHNRYGKPQALRSDWLPKDAMPAAKADLLYFVGCRSSFDSTELATSTAQIMVSATVPFMLMPEEPCCGHFVYVTGQLEKAKKIARENLEQIRRAGAKTVAASCAECYKTIKVDYPKVLGFSTSDLGFEVKHITELADGWVKDGRLKLTNPIGLKVTYHDSCNLGRLSEPWSPWEGLRRKWGIFDPPRTVRRGVHGLYEQPRTLLRAIPGLELTEMVRHHDSAWCCGAGGGVKEAFPDFADWTAGDRTREAIAGGAEAIVSSCPGCKSAFRGASANGLKAYDITELLAMACSHNSREGSR